MEKSARMETTEKEGEQLQYLVSRKTLYRDEVTKSLFLSEGGGSENPFNINSFPMMFDIHFDEYTGMGKLIQRPSKGVSGSSSYEETVDQYHKARYLRHGSSDEGLINNVASSATMPRLYNVVTGEVIKNSLDARLNNDSDLVIKVVDLGDIWYRYTRNVIEGNRALRQIYNEIRAGFFLNELRYAYEKTLTHHFMIVIDWFVSDVNLYPSIKGNGPFQYIVSERLDTPLYQYLSKDYADMQTLKCTLFCIAQAIEAAWATHRYIHFDLHFENIMLKASSLSSPFRDKDYLYTRVYSDKTYRLPQSGLHNTMVKILDFGNNYMKVPNIPRGKDKTDLYDHIEHRPIDGSEIHEHPIVLAHRSIKHGTGLSENRTWDMRRIMWDLMTKWPIAYWREMKKETPVDFQLLVTQMSQLIDIKRVLMLGKENGLGAQKLFRVGVAGATGLITVEDILLSPIRGLYIDFYFGFDFYYMELVMADGDDDELLRQYRASQAKKLYSLDDIDEVDRKLEDYDQWHNFMMYNHVWTDWQTSHSASTFLSSPFFESLVVTDISDGDCVWVGERPSSHVIPMNKTY